MHSLAQWSTTTNTVAVPSRRVRQLVASIPHIWSGCSVVIVPSCAFGPCACPPRVGARSCASRISRSTRALDVRTPCQRNRAHTLRWPSPRKGAAASTVWIRSSSSASLHCGFGPRFWGPAAGVVRRA